MSDFLLSIDVGLWGLALSAFLSSTLLPGGSEAVLLLLAQQGNIAWPALLIVASLANGLGGVVTYAMGFWVQRGLVKSGRIKPPTGKTLAYLRRFGVPLLLFSWLPVIGDGLCLGAGWLQMRSLPVVLSILVGKFFRYAALLYFFMH